MKWLPTLLALGALLLSASPAGAIDYDKIDRTIAKEPIYRSKAPKYVLLVFGPEAKSRVWLVLDGDALYVDRKGNGDLSDKENRLLPTEKSSPDWRVFGVGKVTCPNEEGVFSLDVRLNSDSDGRWGLQNTTCQPARGKGFRQHTEGFIPLADQPRDAAIVHFAGPLTMTVMEWGGNVRSRKLEHGERGSQLSILVGTPVISVKQEAFVAMKECFRQLAPDIFPEVEIEFPPKSPQGKGILVKAAVRH